MAPMTEIITAVGFLICFGNILVLHRRIQDQQEIALSLVKAMKQMVDAWDTNNKLTASVLADMTKVIGQLR